MPQLSVPLFPNSQIEPFEITSPLNKAYNCIAWAYGVDTKRFWPNSPYYYWPDDVINDESIEAFVQLFASIGYELCNNGDLENGVEKIAIYALNGEPKHAAKQLPSGLWSSKLGEQEDVSHTLFGMRAGYYGTEIVFMSRPIGQ